MTESTENLALLDSVQYLYLREITEPRDNTLRVVVQEAISSRANSRSMTLPGIPDHLLPDAAPIESTDACKTFILSWPRYVAYLVTEEGAGSCGKYEDETFIGRLFRQYRKSHFLEHIGRDTGGHFESCRHYKIICLNHLIDIISTFPPEVEVVEGNVLERSPHSVQ